MEKINLIPRIREIYSRGENIIEFLKRENGTAVNTTDDILISYDFQAGSYVQGTKENPLYNAAYTGAIARVLNNLGAFNTLLEVGVGEATTLANVATKLEVGPVGLMGFDISWSRINCGIGYLREMNVQANLFVADLFNIPLPDNSVDIVYTAHSIEPNGGREREALKELFRVTRKYLILLEPTDEFADAEGRTRMKKNGYVQNLKSQIMKLNYNLTDYRKFDVTINPLNPTGLYIIKKDELAEEVGGAAYCCPISKKKLVEYSDHLFSTELLISYPKIMGIPCLCPSYGILTTKHEQ